MKSAQESAVELVRLLFQLYKVPGSETINSAQADQIPLEIRHNCENILNKLGIYDYEWDRVKGRVVNLSKLTPKERQAFEDSKNVLEENKRQINRLHDEMRLLKQREFELRNKLRDQKSILKSFLARALSDFERNNPAVRIKADVLDRVEHAVKEWETRNASESKPV